MKYKVIFFDSWKGGAHNYSRHLSAFKDAGIESMLLHLGSWGNEDEYEKEEHLNGLKMRDISYYNGKGFEEIIIEEKPDLVLFLSIHTFAHRAFNRYCQKHGIPTILLYHGLIRVQDVDNKKKSAYKTNPLSYGLFILKRVPKLLQYTFPCYIRSIYATGGKINDYVGFINNIIQVFTRPATFQVSSDSKTTRCLIYAKPDRLHAHNIYNFQEDEIAEVGNPDLMAFGLKQEMIGGLLRKDQNGFTDVMYLDTALTAAGLVFQSQSEYIKFILDTHQTLQKYGKKLILKPHPDTRKTYNLDVFKDGGVEVIDNSKMIERLETCCCALTEPSTISLVPALMGLPLLLVGYDKAESLSYGEVLKSYPRANLINNLTGINEILTRTSSFNNIEDTLSWINTNSGPLPSEKMPERVTENVLQLIESSPKPLFKL